ncbi:MAG: undecaprenyl-diphosphate phosphatase [Candidatus Pacebacteria bacterium]|nr:undecaprenyl-diphosphate phosphatase [Candidatus Paceibacterota bacterium]
MDFTSAIILGAVQGITEFLPISSSGHLILAREALGLETFYGLSIDAVLQLATSLAILLYFWRDFWKMAVSGFNWLRGRVIPTEERILIIALVVGTIPAIIFGLLLEGMMETTFRSAELVAWTLILGAVFFFVAERLAKQSRTLNVKRGFWIGMFQVLALIPGMSRSGSTIAGGLLLGLSRTDAAHFGFMLGFPIIFGSGMKKLLELGGNGGILSIGWPLAVGAATAFIVGVLAMHLMMRYLKNHTLDVFVIYRIALAVLVLYFVA